MGNIRHIGHGPMTGLAAHREAALGELNAMIEAEQQGR
jgi:hypothetical protein